MSQGRTNLAMDPGFPRVFPLVSENHRPPLTQSRLLATLLQGSQGSLAASLSRGTAGDLKSALGQLSPVDRRELKAQAGTGLDHWSELAQETSPEFFHRGLYSLGRKAEERGSGDLAHRVYQELLGNKAVAPELKAEAQERLALLSGGGSLGGKIEKYTEGAVEGVLDLSLLVGIGVGGIGFRVGRMWGANFLGGTGKLGWNQVLAVNALGMAVELPAFTTAAKLTRMGLGHEEEWSGKAFGEEMLGMGLLLGPVRVLQGGMKGLHGLKYGRHGAKAQVYQQVGMLSGIGVGHGLQQAVGYREFQGAGDFVLETLFTWGHFNAAGYVAHRVMPKSIRRFEERLELRTQELMQDSGRRIQDFMGEFVLGHGQRVYAGVPHSPSRSGKPLFPQLVFTKESKKGEPEAPGILTTLPPEGSTHPSQRPIPVVKVRGPFDAVEALGKTDFLMYLYDGQVVLEFSQPLPAGQLVTFLETFRAKATATIRELNTGELLDGLPVPPRVYLKLMRAKGGGFSEPVGYQWNSTSQAFELARKGPDRFSAPDDPFATAMPDSPTPAPRSVSAASTIGEAVQKSAEPTSELPLGRIPLVSRPPAESEAAQAFRLAGERLKGDPPRSGKGDPSPPSSQSQTMVLEPLRNLEEVWRKLDGVVRSQESSVKVALLFTGDKALSEADLNPIKELLSHLPEGGVVVIHDVTSRLNRVFERKSTHLEYREDPFRYSE